MPIATAPANAVTPAKIQSAAVSTSIALLAPSVSIPSGWGWNVSALPHNLRAVAMTRGTSAAPRSVFTRNTVL